MREQPRHLGIVAHQHQISRLAARARVELCRNGVDDPGGGIRRLEAAYRGKGRERIATAPERFCSLLGAEFSAVPDERRFHTARRRFLRQEVDFDAAACGKRPRRVDVWSNGIAVMNEV